MTRVPAHVRRARLVDVIAASPRLVITAPGGYGKTSLIVEAADVLELELVRFVAGEQDALPSLVPGVRAAFARAGFTQVSLERAAEDDELADAVMALLDEPTTPPVLLCIDEAHRLGGTALAALHELSVRWSGPHHLAIVGRRAPVGFAGHVHLGEGDLAFSIGEVAELCGGAGSRVDVVRIHEQLAGWPAAVALLGVRWGSAGPAILADDRSASAVLDELVRFLLDRADPATRELLAWLAAMPALSEPLVDAIGGAGAWRRIVEFGCPLLDTRPGWSRFSDPVRDRLGGIGALPDEVADRAAQAFVAHGAVDLAFQLLLRRGRRDAAAHLLGTLHLTELEQLDSAHVRAIVSFLGGEIVLRHPRILVQQARLAALVGAIGERAALLEAARAHAGDLGSAFAREVDAELALDMSRQSLLREAEELSCSVLASAGPDELMTRATCRAALGLALATRVDRADHTAAAAHLREAATMFDLLGARTEAANALLWLGYWIEFAHGDLDRAPDTLRAAMSMLGRTSVRRGSIATFLAEVLARTGRTNEALEVLDEAFRIGRERGDQLTVLYASWTAAEVAAQAHDRDRAMLHIDDASRLGGDWWAHSTGTDFLADAANVCRRLDEHDRARELLARAAVGPQGTVPTYEIAAAAFEAAVGDAAAGLGRLEALTSAPGLFAVDRPRTMLLAAVAAHRLGDGRAPAMAAAAHEAAAAMGVPDLLRVVERRASEIFDAKVATLRPPEVRLLGRFEVTRAGRPVTLLPGMGSMLVKRLALAGRPWTLDEVLDALWPDTDTGTARRRLRNLLNRLREESGELVVRTESGLALAPGCRIDVDDYRAAARTALAAAPDDLEGAAQAAIERYVGELLPEDRYDDWAALEREQLARLQLSVLDRAAAGAAARGEHAGAMRHLDDAIAIDPYEEERYVLAAEAALAAGQRRRAAEHLVRAAVMLHELGVAPSARHRSVAAATHTVTGRPPDVRLVRSEDDH